jgi:hypothetical protein
LDAETRRALGRRHRERRLPPTSMRDMPCWSEKSQLNYLLIIKPHAGLAFRSFSSAIYDMKKCRQNVRPGRGAPPTGISVSVVVLDFAMRSRGNVRSRSRRRRRRRRRRRLRQCHPRRTRPMYGYAPSTIASGDGAPRDMESADCRRHGMRSGGDRVVCAAAPVRGTNDVDDAPGPTVRRAYAPWGDGSTGRCPATGVERLIVRYSSSAAGVGGVGGMGEEGCVRPPVDR